MSRPSGSQRGSCRAGGQLQAPIQELIAMSTENTVQSSGERDVIAPRDSHQPILAPRDSHQPIITPRDSHQPIIRPGVTPQAPKPRDRDVVRPTDSHQPIAGAEVEPTDASAGEAGHESAD